MSGLLVSSKLNIYLDKPVLISFKFVIDIKLLVDNALSLFCFFLFFNIWTSLCGHPALWQFCWFYYQFLFLYFSEVGTCSGGELYKIRIQLRLKRKILFKMLIFHFGFGFKSICKTLRSIEVWPVTNACQVRSIL